MAKRRRPTKRAQEEARFLLEIREHHVLIWSLVLQSASFRDCPDKAHWLAHRAPPRVAAVQPKSARMSSRADETRWRYMLGRRLRCVEVKVGRKKRVERRFCPWAARVAALLDKDYRLLTIARALLRFPVKAQRAKEARDRLVGEYLDRNMPLIRRIGRRYAPHDADPAIVDHVARIAAARSIDRFDPLKGTAWSTYAAYWIRQQVQRDSDLRAPGQIRQVQARAALQRVVDAGGDLPQAARERGLTEVEATSLLGSTRAVPLSEDHLVEVPDFDLHHDIASLLMSLEPHEIEALEALADGVESTTGFAAAAKGRELLRSRGVTKLEALLA